MLTVHHLGISQSERIVWLCEELELPYRLVRYDRDPVTRLAPPEYKALHPFGTAPVITDGEFVLAESGAIIEYLLAKHGDGRLVIAPGRPEFADYLFWLHFANASMLPSMMVDIIVQMTGASSQDTLQRLRARSDRGFDLVNKTLADRSYFAGSSLTAADIIMLFPLTTMRHFVPRDLSPYPNIRSYLQRIGARPAYQRAMKKAEPTLVPLLD